MAFKFLLFITVHFGNAMALNPFAQGNLFVVFDAQTGRTSETHHIYHQNLTDLWCQATRDGESRLAIKSSRFLQVLPHPVRSHRAHLSSDNRSYLHFEERVSPEVIGKYKCEITTIDNEFVTGNLFVYMRPVFQANSNLRMEKNDDVDPFSLTVNSQKITRGETANLLCPVIGYPVPDITWYKDTQPIAANDLSKYRLYANGELQIFSVDDPDEGIYKCVAENSFPLKLDSSEHTFKAQLEVQLRVASSLSWLIPLIIIFVTVILLIIIIYVSAWWKRYQYAQYHVEKKERCIRKAEEKQLENELDFDD